MREAQGRLRRRLLWGAASVIAIVWALGPVGWLLSLSLKPTTDLGDRRFLPTAISFESYRSIFGERQFVAALLNSTGIAVLSTIFALLLGMLAAWAIVRYDFRGRRLVLAGALAVGVFPPVALVGPLFDMWRRLGLFDTWPGLVLPYMSFTLPLAIWVLSTFFREIPWELEQAARVDGATPLQAFFRVIVPLAAPGVLAAGVLVFLFAWNDFLFAISLTSTDRARTAPAALAFFSGRSQFEQPIGSITAAAVVVTIPVVLLVLLLQRRIVAGLTAGAVKG